jgi:hypothetical protein
MTSRMPVLGAPLAGERARWRGWGPDGSAAVSWALGPLCAGWRIGGVQASDHAGGSLRRQAILARQDLGWTP